MSIIERALQKAQQQGKAGAGDSRAVCAGGLRTGRSDVAASTRRDWRRRHLRGPSDASVAGRSPRSRRAT